MDFDGDNDAGEDEGDDEGVDDFAGCEYLVSWLWQLHLWKMHVEKKKRLLGSKQDLKTMRSRGCSYMVVIWDARG